MRWEAQVFALAYPDGVIMEIPIKRKNSLAVRAILFAESMHDALISWEPTVRQIVGLYVCVTAWVATCATVATALTYLWGAGPVLSLTAGHLFALGVAVPAYKLWRRRARGGRR